jgi:hypothetical protein
MQGNSVAFYVTSLANLNVQWSGFGLTLAHAVLCLGSEAQHCDMATVDDVFSGAGQKSMSSMALPEGSPVYATIRISQDGKQVCASSSSVLRLDTTAPVLGLVNIGHNAGSPPYWANS